jgi:amino acid adenylation domain-containing protein
MKPRAAEARLALDFSCDDTRLGDLLERSAAKHPQLVAAVFDDDERTYAELNASANRIARALFKLGAGAETLVAVCLERSLDTLALIAGITKTGAAYVPLDVSWPDERLRLIVRESAPAILITNNAGRKRFTPQAGMTLLTLDEACEMARGESDANIAALGGSRSLAYVIYTSGSTGAPKGVMVEHRSACNMVLSALGDLGIRSTDRVLQLAPLSFDPSVWQIFGTLSAGGCIVLPPPGTERDVDAVMREIHRHDVTVLMGVPALLSMLSERDDFTEARSLRVVVSGGAQLSPVLAKRLMAPGRAVVNVYGPTEAGIHATEHRCVAHDTRPFVPLGSPIANVRLYVLDEQLNPVPHGRRGEIFIGGPGVARGYLGLPDLTAERFFSDPFVPGVDERMYRTGDFARRHWDGCVEFAGRSDDQVKVRGVRVELGEIVAMLEGHPNVASAAAILSSDERILAYVVPRIASDGFGDSLRKYASEKLPPAAVPSAFFFLSELPRRSNGKFDRDALAPVPPQQRVAPVRELPDSLHVLVTQVWEELLGIRGIGTSENFFEIGGYSLLAARLTVRIEASVGRRLPIKVLFENPTIGGMVAALRQSERAEFEPIVALRSSGSKPPFFFLHGDSTGLGLYCRRFGDGLGAGRPIYAVAPHGADGGAVPQSIEEMARDRLRLILEIEPEGPYLLGGYCMGAIVAFEMARQLQRLGKRVQHLVLVEAQHARYRYAVFEGLFARLARCIGVGDDRSHRWLARQRASLYDLRCRLPPFAHYEDALTAHVKPAQERAVRGYVWQTLGVPATMVCAREERSAARERVQAMWSPLLPMLDVRIIPGDHETVLVQNVDSLVAELARTLEKAGA